MHIFFDNGERRIQTISSAHLKLGGNDWSVALGDLVREKFCYETGCDFTEMKEDPDSVAWFEENIEKMKKHLTNHKSSAVAPVFNGCKERIVITEEEFREATSSLLDLTIECVNNMLFGNKNDFELPVDEILIVGGSSKMPQVIDRLGCEYNKPMITCFDPEFSIVKGVALTANELWRRNLEHSNEQIEDQYGILFNSNSRLLWDAWSTHSIGIKIFFDGSEKILNLVYKGDSLPKKVNSENLIDISVGFTDEIATDIDIVLVKNQSCEMLSDLDEFCSEYSEVIFKSTNIRKKDILHLSLYIDACAPDSNCSSVDTLSLLNDNGEIIKEEQIIWKKRAYLTCTNENQKEGFTLR